MKKLLTMSLALVGTLALVGVASAATPADTLQPATTITYNEELVVNDTIRVDSAYIGKQGTGGVTFFNGTIVNSTTGDDDADNPVTFGDNVRIDGRVYRGETAGTSAGDSLPFIINDNAEVAGVLAVGSLGGTGVVSSTNIADGAVGTADLASSSVTSAKISDGTIASADLASNSVTGAKITNGTITGSDISSSADLSINTLAASGNITTSGTVDGVDVSTISSTYVSQASPSWNSQSGIITVPAYAFMPEDDTVMGKANYTSVLYLDGASAVDETLHAPVQLPDGATVTGFTMNFYDASVSDTITTRLRRVSVASAGFSNLSDEIVSTDAQPGSVSDTSIDNATVDNDGYAYLVEAVFSDADQGVNLRLISAEVTYTFTAPY